MGTKTETAARAVQEERSQGGTFIKGAQDLPEIEKLQSEIRALDGKIDAMQKAAIAENRDFTPNENDQVMQSIGSIKAMKKAIDGIRAKAGTPEGARMNVDGGGYNTAAGEQRGGIPGKCRAADLFGPPAADDFADFRSLQRAVESRDPRLRAIFDKGERRAMGESVPSGGGFFIGETKVAEVLDNALEQMVVMPRARVFPVGPRSDRLSIPAWDNGTHTSTVYGGITGTWLAEGGTGTPADPKLKMVTLTVNKLITYLRTSSELSDDLNGGVNMLGTMLSRALGWYLDAAFLNGDGAGKPLGIMSSPALITVDKTAGQDADTIEYRNLCDMFGRSSNPTGSVWIVNPSAVPELLSLSQIGGVASTPVPVMTESGGVFKILTRPVVFSEHAQLLGDKGDIMFCDLSQYAIALRQDFTLEKSNAVAWLTDQVDMRCKVRVDGQPLLDAAITLEHGGTVSPFVTLEART